MPIGVNSPTIEDISREIVHRLPPQSPPLEKVPTPRLELATQEPKPEEVKTILPIFYWTVLPLNLTNRPVALFV